MNNAEHIHNRLEDLVERGFATPRHLLLIIQSLVGPYMGGEEPRHFTQANKIVHRLLKASESE